jgi:hypothetical protein
MTRMYRDKTRSDIWKPELGSCYKISYITGGVLYHIFLLYNMLYKMLY